MGEKMTVNEVHQKAVELERRMDGVESKIGSLGENMQKILMSMDGFLSQRQLVTEENSREGKAESGGNSYREVTKIPFPIFDGHGYRTWRHKCEQFFALEKVSDEQKLKLLLMAMEGKAFAWQKHFVRSEGNNSLSWEQFLDAVGARFDVTSYNDPMSELVNLKQSGSLVEYMEAFDELVARLAIDEQTALSCFLGGLKGPLEKALRLQKPKTINAAMAMARIQEDLLIELSLQLNDLAAGKDIHSVDSVPPAVAKFYKAPVNPTPVVNYSNTNFRNLPAKTHPTYHNTTKNSNSTSATQESSHNNRGIGQSNYRPLNKGNKEVSQSEPSRRMARGLYKFCGEKFDLNHRSVCKVWGRLNALWLEQEEDEKLVEEEVSEAIQSSEETDGREDIQISLQALQGVVGGNTMQLLGKVKKQLTITRV